MAKILILGNGFDLAHGLPTSYADFLEFSKRAMYIYTYNNDSSQFDWRYKEKLASWAEKSETNRGRGCVFEEKLIELSRTRKIKEVSFVDDTRKLGTTVVVNVALDKFYKDLISNIWYDYFLDQYENRKIKGENWIDFESEMSFIIQVLDNAHESMAQTLCDLIEKQTKIVNNTDWNSDKFKLFINICKKYYQDDLYRIDQNFTIRALRERLYADLNRFILAFEIYLVEFVDTIEIKEQDKIKSIASLAPDYVISFNYTKTYERYYKKPEHNTRFCYIHGVCDKNRSEFNNNMVMGIDEYLPETLRSERVDFCIFKKFVQRIRKRNDVSYATWSEEIENAKEWQRGIVPKDGKYVAGIIPHFSEIYIYGHSLDLTDKDILKRFLSSKHTRIHIFSRDKASEGELISKLLQIVGEDIVVEKATNNPLMLQFITMSQTN